MESAAGTCRGCLQLRRLLKGGVQCVSANSAGRGALQKASVLVLTCGVCHASVLGECGGVLLGVCAGSGSSSPCGCVQCPRCGVRVLRSNKVVILVCAPLWVRLKDCELSVCGVSLCMSGPCTPDTGVSEGIPGRLL